MREVCIEAIRQNRVIAIVRGVEEKNALQVAQALYEGGIRLMELTFVQNEPEGFEAAARTIAAISGAMEGKMTVGAGTVLTLEQLSLAKTAGAAFVVSPNANTAIIEATRAEGMVSLPGAFTPSEILTAYDAGADYVKLFPAAQMGVDYIKAIRAPISHVPLLAFGGIHAGNLRAFLDAGCAGVGVGSILVKPDDIARQKYAQLTEAARTLLSAL